MSQFPSRNHDFNRSATTEITKPHHRPASINRDPALTSKQHHRDNSILELGEEILKDLSSPAHCKKCCHAWLCQAKRNPGLEIFLYIFFFVTLIFLSIDVKGSTVTFFYSNLIEDIIVHEEFPSSDSHVRKDFNAIGEVNEFWSFIHGPFANAMFNSRTNICQAENLEPGCYSRRASLFYSDFVLLDIRFKQNRVKRFQLNGKGNDAAAAEPHMCRVPEWIKGMNLDAWNAIEEQGCYPEYSYALEDQESPFNTTSKYEPSVEDCFHYNKRLFDWTTTGTIYPYPYGAGGYSCFLKADSLHAQNATKWLHDLEKSTWLDAGTRMVMIDFTVYSANIDTFLFFRVGVEQSPTGGLIPFYDNYAIELGDVVNGKTLLLRLALAFFLIIFFIQEVSECCVDGCKKYCHDIWNVLEVINLMLFALYFGLLFLAELTLIHERSTENFDIQSIGAIRTFADNTLALNMVISSVKVFKYIKVSKRMSLMLTTFYEARYSLLALLILVLIFLVGFAMAFYVAFGHRIIGFRSFSRSFKTLSTSLLDEFEFNAELERVNWLLGPLLYFMYQVFVSFVLLSLLIAIIEDAFQTTQKALEENHEKDKLVSAMKATGINIWKTVISGVNKSSNSIVKMSSKLRTRTKSFQMRRRTKSAGSRNSRTNWFGRKSKTNLSGGSGGGSKSESKENPAFQLKHMNGKEKDKQKGRHQKRETLTFLQAVIASGKKEKQEEVDLATKKEEGEAADLARKTKKVEEAKEAKEAKETKETEATKRNSHKLTRAASAADMKAQVGSNSGDFINTLGSVGGQSTAHNNRVIAMTREVTRETTRTNSKIVALEEKMDMILAALDAMGSMSPRRPTTTTTLNSLTEEEEGGASGESLPQAVADVDFKKEKRKRQRRKTRRSSSVLPPGWKKYREDETGKTYYVNQYTEESSWVKPRDGQIETEQ